MLTPPSRPTPPTLSAPCRPGYKFKPHVLERIYRGARLGLHLQDIARLARISRKTLWLWLREGEKEVEAAEEREEQTGEEADLGPLGAFYIEFHYQQALLASEMVQVVVAAAQRGEWRAAAWMLERRFPGDWAERLPEGGGRHATGAERVRAREVEVVYATTLDGRPLPMPRRRPVS